MGRCMNVMAVFLMALVLYTLRTQQEFFENHPVERNLVSYINRHYRDPYGKSR